MAYNELRCGTIQCEAVYEETWDGKIRAVREGELSDMYILPPPQITNKKHRCPNCGATKIINDKCEYCGT